MKEFNLKDQLPRVKAPESFEEEVLQKIRVKRAAKKRPLLILIRIFRFRPLLVGALLGILVAGFIVIPSMIKEKQATRAIFSSNLPQLVKVGSSYLSLIESVDFNKDLADIPTKRVVYILEAVNENFISDVKY
ncbi:MAG: hypothetical protein N3B16_02225 [Candidatus Aminicenantes bacterium]|nr:hypothetical protein [Candidatus Aminicenantes bacterium]